MQPTVTPNLNNQNNQNTENKNEGPITGNGPVDLDAPGAEFGLDVRQVCLIH